MGHMPIRIFKTFPDWDFEGKLGIPLYCFVTTNWDRVNYFVPVNLTVPNAPVTSGYLTARHERAWKVLCIYPACLLPYLNWIQFLQIDLNTNWLLYNCQFIRWLKDGMRWKRISRRIETGEKSEHSTGYLVFRNCLLGTLFYSFSCILPARRKAHMLFSK